MNQAETQADPTRLTPIRFTATFSEPIDGPGLISYAGSTANVNNAFREGTSPDRVTWHISVSGVSSNGDFVRANLVSYKDLAGNSGSVSPSIDNTVTLDNVRPTVTINQAPGQSDPTVGQPVRYSVVFSEKVNGFSPSDISLALSTANITSPIIIIIGTGATYEVLVSNIGPGGTVRASVISSAAQDALGNLSFLSTSSDNSVTVEFGSISGRVTSAAGNGVRGASVALVDNQGSIRTVSTSSLGYFSFGNLIGGKQYSIRVSSRRFRFESFNVLVIDDMSLPDIVGLE